MAGKPLSEMNKEELWQLFPILLTAPQTEWAAWYETERAMLLTVLKPEAICRIAHIGSTAVGTIWAKPTVDILLEVVSDCDCEQVIDTLARCGYTVMSRSAERLSFCKGYTENGFAQKVYHLHVRRCGDHDELYFRDWLLTHPEDATEYERLKLHLWKRFEHDRDAYTEAKTEFIVNRTALAKAEYPGRYE